MFKFHPIIQESYLEVHDWLSTIRELEEYRTNSARSRVKRKLAEPTFESAALQYYVFFPGHSAKVGFTLTDIIDDSTIVEWLKHNSHITIIDVGCGAGAASIAFVNCLLNLRDEKKITQPINIHFVGIDSNIYAIAIYRQLLNLIQEKVQNYGIIVTNKLIAESNLRAVSDLRIELARKREQWGVPYLTHTFLFQANVVSPFSERHTARTEAIEKNRQTFERLGIPVEELEETHELFGKEEAIAYKRILENALIDNLHVITVGTEGFEASVSELVKAIDDEFESNSHVVKKWEGGEFNVKCLIPDGCYWREHKDTEEHNYPFCAEVSSISNVALADEDWQELKSTRNLQVAWARARHHLLAQTLVDEVEIRLFESKLDENIARLQQQLEVYANDIVHSDDRLHFKFPKNTTQLRPFGLSRIEEEILSTALIQKLGQEVSALTSRSYAYKFSRSFGKNNTEYLYENWFDAYGKYISDARTAAQNIEGCIVIQTDIKSFYTRIIRDSLSELSAERLSRSSRVEWLLRLLFARELDDHEVGRGIVQGNIASGFFANLYLVDLDTRFGAGNEWDVEFFRYVDDMIIVIREEDRVDEVLTELMVELDKVGLVLNEKKTERFDSVSEFKAATENDEELDNLQNQFQDLINCLWILDSEHRKIFREAYGQQYAEWWYRLEIYQKCLSTIGVFIDVPLLSRRIYKYLFNDKLCEKNFTWENPFNAPSLPFDKEKTSIQLWQEEFQSANISWIERKNELASIFFDLLCESRAELIRAIDSADVRSEKRWIRTMRFCLNKLIQIEFQDENVAQMILDILLETPWFVRNPHKIIKNLATRGFIGHILTLLDHFDDESNEMNEYMKSIALKAIRFLPSVSKTLWEKVVESAISQSIVISLMATETWLKVVQRNPELVNEDQLRLIMTKLHQEPKPILRLQKNYILILGENKQDVDFYRNNEQDDLLQNVIKIIQDNDVDSLFDYYEPEILTREYYSGYRTEDGDYHPSPS